MPLAFFDSFGTGEMLVIGIIAVLLFGKRLPEVGRSLGKSVSEFKRSIQGLQDEFRAAADPGSSAAYRAYKDPEPVDDDEEPATAPKFVPPGGANAPVANSPSTSPASGDPAKDNPVPSTEA